jgi:hypothetical protein
VVAIWLVSFGCSVGWRVEFCVKLTNTFEQTTYGFIFIEDIAPNVLAMSEVQDVLNKFNMLDSSLKKVFSKIDPLLVVSLIFDKNANKENIYTLEVIVKPGQDTEAIRNLVISKTGMAPAFYLRGTKVIVSHTLDLDFLKWINDQTVVVSVKGSKFSAGGSSDF